MQDESLNKILIVEDEEAIANLIKINLQHAGYSCEVANDGITGADMLENNSYDLCLFDIMLPGINGYELLEYAKSLNMPVIFLSAKGETIDKVKGLRLGADDYITKPFNPLELVARVKSQIRRYTQLGSMSGVMADEAVYTTGGLSINDDLKEVTVDGEPVKLTPIEYNILLLLVKNQGRVFSIEQIYESIWNEEALGADNTVAVHIRHIREKIEINPKEPRYLKVVWGVGYKVEKL